AVLGDSKVSGVDLVLVDAVEISDAARPDASVVLVPQLVVFRRDPGAPELVADVVEVRREGGPGQAGNILEYHELWHELSDYRERCGEHVALVGVTGVRPSEGERLAWRAACDEADGTDLAKFPGYLPRVLLEDVIFRPHLWVELGVVPEHLGGRRPPLHECLM